MRGTLPFLALLVAAAVLAASWVGHRLNTLPPVLQVHAVSRGLRLTLTVPQTTYPANALVAVTLRVDNVSRHSIDVGRNSNSDCQAYSAHALVQRANGTTLYPPVIFPGYMGSCAEAGGYKPLPPGQSVTTQQYVVLRADQLRARLFLPGDYESDPIDTPDLTVHVVPSRAPAFHIHSGRLPWARLVRPSAARGPLYVVSNWFCKGLDPQGQNGISAALQTEQQWLVSPSARLQSGEPGCRRVVWWRAVAGWLGEPVATIRYGKEPNIR